MEYILIAEIEDGILTGLYTDSPAAFSVTVTDPEDIYDPERAAVRKEIEQRINSGTMKNLLHNQQMYEIRTFDNEAELLRMQTEHRHFRLDKGTPVDRCSKKEISG